MPTNIPGPRTKRPREIDISTTRFARTIRQLILSAAIVFAFVWISFTDFAFDTFMASYPTPIPLWHVALSLYYISWIAGATFDVHAKELIYVEFPHRAWVPLHGMITILALIGAGLLLAWSTGNIQRFTIAIDIFLVLDNLAWQYVIWLLTPVKGISRRLYKQRRNYLSLEKLRVVCHQILGNWKWWRFTGTIPILIILHALAFSNTIQSYITTTVVALVPLLSTADANAFISALLVLLFVLVAEI